MLQYLKINPKEKRRWDKVTVCENRRGTFSRSLTLDWGRTLVDEKQSRLRALFEKHREIIMYLVFGLVTTFISWSVYSLFVTVLPFDIDTQLMLFGKAIEFNINIFVSNILSWIIAATVAFVTNKLWVFDSKSWEASLVRKEALTFFAGRGVTGIFEILAVPLLVGWGLNQTLFGRKGLPAKMIVTVAVVILNYIFSKFFSFRKKDTASGE